MYKVDSRPDDNVNFPRRARALCKKTLESVEVMKSWRREHRAHGLVRQQKCYVRIGL